MKTVATILLLCFGVFLSTAQSPVKQSDKSGSIKSSSNDKVFDENFVMQYPQEVDEINSSALAGNSSTKSDFAGDNRALLTPFNCADGFVYILTNTTSSNGNVTSLFSYNLGTNTQTLIKSPLIASTNSSQFVNGIGYNILDNYLYGLLVGTNKLVRIDASGNIEYLTISSSSAIGTFSSGDVSEDGILYLYGSNKFVSIDLNPSSSQYLVLNNLLNYSSTIHDITFSPIDGNMYMMTSNGNKNLLRFNISSNTITNLGVITGLQLETTSSYGTAFMDSSGNMFISNNSSGNVYKIASPHTGGLSATFYNSLMGNPGDGARCPNQIIAPNAVADQVCTVDNDDITINVLQNDTEGTNPLDISSVMFLDPITSTPSTSVTISGQGTFSVNNTGVVTFSPQNGFTQATIQYTVADSVGTLSNPATITVDANTIAAPTGPALQEFCESELPTIANLIANGSSIQWYANETTLTQLPTTTSLEDQTTYYASQQSAAGCVSIDRLAVTVNLNANISLVGSESVACSADGMTYNITATFNGEAPFTATGSGAPGNWTLNSDGTSTWTSASISNQITDYSVEIQDNNGCNSITLSGSAPSDCLLSPFDCDEGLAYILTNTGSGTNNFVTGLYSLNLATNVQTLIKYPLIASTTTSQFINGIGYNVLDNFIYGYLQNSNQIVKIDASGNVYYLTITGSFTPGDYSSGDINQNGQLYLHGLNKFVTINLDASSPDYLKATNLLNYPLTINDMTFSPIDNNIYMMTSSTTPKLLRYNTASNTVTPLGNVSGLSSETTPVFGTAFMDNVGNMYVANNASGKIYKIATPHTGNLSATFFSGALTGLNPGDGARCPNQIIEPMANDDSICATNTTPVSINITLNDGEGTFPLVLSSVSLIDPVTLVSGTTVTITGQGTFTVDSSGVLTFTPLSSFTGTSIQYTIADTMGNVSGPATVTVFLNNIVAPTGEANQIFCLFDQPTVGDLQANGNNIQWYESASSTTALVSTTPLVDGMNYYASQVSINDCESNDRLEVTVTITETETPDGSATQIFCDTDQPTVDDLQANGTNILWYDSASSTTPLNLTTPLINEGIYYASQTSAEGCESIGRFIVTVIINPTSEGPTGEASQTFCISDNPTVSDLIANGSAIQWYESATSTTPLDPSTLLVDQAVYYGSQTLAAGCESINRLEVTVTLNPASETPTGEASQAFCASLNPTIMDLVANGTNIQWFESATSDTPLDPDTALVDQAVYFASQTTTSDCGSTDRLEVTVTLNVDISLASAVATTCSAQDTSYTLEFTVTGVAPFSATGTGSSGIWTDNADGTSTYVSSPINYQTDYSLEIQDANACNTLTVNGDAPDDCFVPFECADGLVYILTNTPSSNGNITALYSFDINTNSLVLIKDPLIQDTSSSQFVNAIGYNVVDNFIYGVLQDTDKILKINQSGEIEFLTITGSFNVGSYSSGDIDANGILYLYGQSKFVSINLNVGASDYLQANTLLNFSATINDITFSTIDNNLYMITSDGTDRLLRFDVTTNLVTTIGSVTGLESETSNSYGTAFMDIAGNMFIANNGSGKVYKIASPHTGGLVATLYSTALAGLNPGDGARCPNQSINPVSTDDMVCTTIDSDVIVNVTDNDASGTFPLDLSSVMLIDPVTSLPVTTVTIPGQGTFTVEGTLGNVKFVPLPTFSGTSVQYTVSDTMGTQTLPSTFTVYLNTTAAPTGQTTQSFCESLNPTVADLVANGQNIQWYDSVSSMTPLDPTTVLIYNAIYYATQTNDEGCESVDRLEVTVILNPDITLVDIETALCDNDGTTYTVVATFTGTAPFTATGIGAPGNWVANSDGTSTFTSDPIEPSTSYAIEIQDINGCNVIALNGTAPVCCTFDITCPTFNAQFVECYGELPTQTSYSVEEFGTLGNGDGIIGDASCGVIEITASNSEDNGECTQTIIRTYTITEYEDTNNNGVRDEGENLVLNSFECVQSITVEDITPPVMDVEASDLTVECDGLGNLEQLENWLSTQGGAMASDSCSDIVWSNDFTALTALCGSTGTATVTFTATDGCGNVATTVAMFTIEDTTAPVIVGDFETVINVNCDAIPNAPSLVFEDACSTDMTVTGPTETIVGDINTNYQIIREWNVNDGCNDYAYTQTINVTVQTSAIQSSSDLCNNIAALDLFDELPSDVDTSGTWVVTSDNATLNGSIFNQSNFDLGDYIFSYTESVAGECPRQYEVTISVIDCIVLPCGEDDVVISTTVTPNGDQFNENFTVTGIESCGFTIELQIFNRWGAKIYENFNYQNDWNGFASKASIGSSDKVPTGTYYYIINLKDSGLKPFAGPIYVATK